MPGNKSCLGGYFKHIRRSTLAVGMKAILRQPPGLTDSLSSLSYTTWHENVEASLTVALQQVLLIDDSACSCDTFREAVLPARVLAKW